MRVEDKNHWVELEQTEIRNKWQVGFPVMKSVTPSCVLRLHRKVSVGPKKKNRCDWVHHRHLSPQLTGQIRSHKDLQWIGCRKCRTKRKEKKLKVLDEVFFERGNKYARGKCNNTEKNTRELHLEMVGDKVTYVRVYWLRSQVRSLDHRSYSSFKLKMGLPFFV